MTKNSNKLRSIKKRCFRKRVSATKKYRSSLGGGSKPVYVLYLVSGSGPAHEKTGIKNRVLDICAVSEDKNELLRLATDVPQEVYRKSIENIDQKDPILNNLYIDEISLGSDPLQPHTFEKVDVLSVLSKMESNEIPYEDIENKKYDITINPRFGLIETISVDKNCTRKQGSEESGFGQMDRHHYIWSAGMTYMFEYEYSVNDRSQEQTNNIVEFNDIFETDIE